MSYMITVGDSDLTTNINQGIDVLLEDMVKDGAITEEQRTEMMRYRIVVHEQGFWGTIWNKLRRTKENQWDMTTIRLVNTFDDILSKETK